MNAVRTALFGIITSGLVHAAVPAAPTAPARPATPELCGLMGTGSRLRFNLKIPGLASSQWLTVGETFGGWKLVQYKSDEKRLVLRRGDGTELALAMNATDIAPAPGSATPAAVAPAAPVAAAPATPAPAATPPASTAPQPAAAPPAATPPARPLPRYIPTPRK